MNGHINFLRNLEADKMIEELPPVDELNVKELAIHRRAYEQGRVDGHRETVRDAIYRFQMATFGHVV